MNIVPYHGPSKNSFPLIPFPKNILSIVVRPQDFNAALSIQQPQARNENCSDSKRYSGTGYINQFIIQIE